MPARSFSHSVATIDAPLLRNLLATHRQSFPVTDDREDAPDGAEVEIPERGGWFRRSGSSWNPIDRGAL